MTAEAVKAGETAEAPAKRRLHHNVEGALWMLASALSFTIMMSLVKYLGSGYSAPVQTFYRQLGGLIFMSPIFIRRGPSLFYTSNIRLMLSRGVATTSGLALSFYAYQKLPLADANALSFTRTLWVVPLAIFLLKEKVGPMRIAAVLVGFLGVLLMARHGKGGGFAFTLPMLAMLASSFILAWAVTGMKVLTRNHSAMTVIAWSTVLGTLFALPIALPTWRWPNLHDFALLAAMGGIAVINQNCFVRGMAVGDASAMAPMDYTRLVFAVAFGLMFFNEVPSVQVLAGATVVIASTLFITWWDQRKRTPKPVAA